MARLKHVGSLASTSTDEGIYAGRSSGLVRRVLVDGETGGSVHQEVSVVELDPGGRIDRHLHAFEQGLYLLEGSLVVEVAGRQEELAAEDHLFVGRGVAHALRNDGGSGARWLEVSAPQPGAAIQDTVFVDGDAPETDADPPYVKGHTGAADLPEPQTTGIALAGFGAANVSGAALEILMGPDSGASQFVLMLLQYAPGGYITEHDHGFEEAFFFLEGEIDVELDGEPHRLRAGDYMWSGAGSMHAMHNRSDRPVRWLETQAPQPPPRYQARFVADWQRFLSSAG